MIEEVFQFYLSGNSEKILLTLSIFIIFVTIILVSFYFLKLMKIDFSFGNFHWRGSKDDKKSDKKNESPSKENTENPLPVIENMRLQDRELIDKILDEIKKSKKHDAKQEILEQQQKISRDYWKAIADNKELTVELDKSKVKIKELTEINTKLRKKVEVLNDKLIKYDIQKEPNIVKFQELIPKLRARFAKIMKNIVLMKRPSSIDSSKYEKFTKLCMDQIIKDFLLNIYNSNTVFTKIWATYDTLRSDFIIHSFEALKSETDIVFKHLRENGAEINKEFKDAKTDLDKKIVAAGNILAKQMHGKIFNNPQFHLESILTSIDKIENFMFLIWDSETFFKIVNRAALETVSLYEKTKQNGIDKNLIVADQLFDSIVLKFEELLKTRLIQRYERQHGKQTS